MRHTIHRYSIWVCLLGECAAACGGRTSVGDGELTIGGSSSTSGTKAGGGFGHGGAGSISSWTGEIATGGYSSASSSRPSSWITATGGATAWRSEVSGGGSALGGTGHSSAAAAGAISKVETWTVEPTDYWFVIDSEETPSQMRLVGVGKDNQIRTYELPGTDMDAQFSNRGDRLCLAPKYDDGGLSAPSNGWVIALKERSFVMIESNSHSRGGCEWVSDDIVAFGETQPECFKVVGNTLVSTMVSPVALSRNAEPSPDGKYAVEQRYDSSGNATLVVSRVNGDGREPLMTFGGRSTWEWSEDSSNLFVLLRSSGGSNLIIDFDFSTGTPIEVNSLATAGAWMLPSPSGEFLLTNLTYDGNEFTLWHPAGGARASLLDVGTFTNPGWVDNSRLMWWSPGPKVANVTSAAISSGAITAVALADSASTNSDCTKLQLTSTLFLDHCSGATTATLHSVELIGDTVVRTALLPGQLGNDRVGSLVGYGLPSNNARVIVAASPSYYYLEYQGNALKRSIRLADYLGDYAVDLSTWIPGDVALLTYLGGASSYGWLSLDKATPGPLIPIPATISSPDAFHFPMVWPKLE